MKRKTVVRKKQTENIVSVENDWEEAIIKFQWKMMQFLPIVSICHKNAKVHYGIKGYGVV